MEREREREGKSCAVFVEHHGVYFRSSPFKYFFLLVG